MGRAETSHRADAAVVTAPATLSDVKVGDQLIALIWDIGVWNQRDIAVHVERLTPTQIIAGEYRFNRGTGRAIGRWGRLLIGEAALEGMRRLKRKQARRAWEYALQLSDFSQQNVNTIRAACDAAEAALREAGEWVDG